MTDVELVARWLEQKPAALRTLQRQHFIACFFLEILLGQELQ